MAFAMAALIGTASMGISVGIWRYEQQLAQTAADSAAVAAAVELKNSGTLAEMYAAANVDSTANGFTGSSSNGALDSTSKVIVTVNNPPTSGAQTTNANAVEVIVSKTLPVYFAWTSLKVSARAVATNPSSSNCMVALDTTQSGNVVTLDSGAQLLAPSCSLASNGWLELNGAKAIDAKSITYRYGITGSATYAEATPILGPQATDPCSTISGCAYLKANPPSNTCTYGQAITAPKTLNPGTYCSGTFTGPGTVTFNAGLYNFVYGFSVNGSVNFVGTGVTIYAPDSVTFGTGTVNISAPTSGNTAGVVFFNAGSYQGLTFNAASTVALTGLVYVPAGNVMLNGTSLSVESLISDTLSLNSNSSITFSGSSSSGGNGGLSE